MNFSDSFIWSLQHQLEVLICNLFMVQIGKLSTGDSLDMSTQDEATIIANDASVKDMEVTFEHHLIRFELNGSWHPCLRF